MIDALVSKGDISGSTVCLTIYRCFSSFLRKLTTFLEVWPDNRAYKGPVTCRIFYNVRKIAKR